MLRFSTATGVLMHLTVQCGYIHTSQCGYIHTSQQATFIHSYLRLSLHYLSPWCAYGAPVVVEHASTLKLVSKRQELLLAKKVLDEREYTL